MRVNKITARERNICISLFVPTAILGFLHVPAQYTIVSMLFVGTFVQYIDDIRFRKIAYSFPLVIWLILTLYHCFNSYVKHVPGVDIIDLLHGIKIYACIVIFTYWASIDVKNTVYILIQTFLLRCAVVLIITMLFPTYTNSGRITGVGGSATGLGVMAAITGIFVTYYNAYKKVGMLKNVAMFLLPMLVIVLAQARNAFAMLSISFFTTMLIMGHHSNKKISWIRVMGVVIVFVTMSFLVMLILGDSAFAQRFHSDREDSYFYQHNATGTIFDKIVGDRLVYYILGFEFFLQSPLTGIGMWNYRYLTGGIYPLHSEYMVHLCEGGFVAAVLWLTFILCVFYVILKFSDNMYIKTAAVSSVCVLLFCGIYARVFFGEVFYPVYGLALSLMFRQTRSVFRCVERK